MAGVYGGCWVRPPTSGQGFAIVIAVSILLGIGGWTLLKHFFSDTAFDAGLEGAIIGGLISGSFALLGVVMSNVASTQAEKTADKKRRKAIAHSVFVKCTAVQDHLTKCYRHYLDGSPALSFRICGVGQFRKPLLGPPFEIAFSDAEMSLGLAEGDIELHNAIETFSRVNQAHSHFKNLYDEKIIEVEKEMAKNAVVQDGKVQSNATLSTYQVAILESVFSGYWSFLLRAYPEAREQHQNLVSILEKSFSTKIEFEFSDDPPQAPNFADRE